MCKDKQYANSNTKSRIVSEKVVTESTAIKISDTVLEYGHHHSIVEWPRIVVCSIAMFHN